MKTWLKRIFGSIGIAISWAVGWAVVGAVIAVVSASLGVPENAGLDPWLALATPGFVGGIIFVVVLRIAEGGRKLIELSLLRSGGWGAVAGLVLGLIPAVAGVAGLAHSTDPAVSLWLITAIVLGPAVVLCAILGVGSALMSRYAVDVTQVVRM